MVTSEPQATKDGTCHTVFVPQRNDHDCVVACVAMWTGIEYDRIVAEINRVNGGVCLWDAVKFLRANGFHARRSVWWFHSYKAILDLPSLNFVGGMHAVYWDGERLFDPNYGRPGKLVWTRALLTDRPNWGGTITETLVEDEPTDDYVLAEQSTISPRKDSSDAK